MPRFFMTVDPVPADHLPIALPATDDGRQTVGVQRQGHRRVAVKSGLSAGDIGTSLDLRTPSVYGLAYAACKLACRRHGAEVIADGASVVTLDIMRQEAARRADALDRHHVARVQRWTADHLPTAATPRERAMSVLDWIAAQEDRLTVRSVPTRFATMTRAYGHAANYRRAVEAAVQRDDHEAAVQAARETWTAAVPTPEEIALWPSLKGGTEAAHEAARDMLSALGLSRLGKVYPLAYAAARAAQGAALDDIVTDGLPTHGRPADVLRWIDGAEAARETVKKRLQRARAAVPSGDACTPEAHAYALGVDGGRALKPTYSRKHSADLETTLRDWIAEEDHAPVIARTDLDMRRAHGPAAPADWTRGLSPATAARYAKAATLRERRARGDAGSTAALPITGAPFKRRGTVR